MAALRALETTELLEMVLLNLSLRGLYSAQRVCKTWHEAIQYSPQLQRRTFRSGCLQHRTQLKTIRNDGVYDDSRTREQRTKHTSLRMPVRLADGTTRAKAIVYADVTFNPVFPSEENTIRFLSSQLQASGPLAASWADMFLTQPSCTYVHVSIYYTKRLPRSIATGWRNKSSAMGTYLVEVRRDSGVRARDVLEEARRRSPAKAVVHFHRIDMFVPGVSKKAP